MSDNIFVRQGRFFRVGLPFCTQLGVIQSRPRVQPLRFRKFGQTPNIALFSPSAAENVHRHAPLAELENSQDAILMRCVLLWT